MTDFNKRLHTLLDDMKDTLAEANGVGLAAPQVGVLRRAVIVVNDEGEMMELVNPELILQEGSRPGPRAASASPASTAWLPAPTT